MTPFTLPGLAQFLARQKAIAFLIVDRLSHAPLGLPCGRLLSDASLRSGQFASPCSGQFLLPGSGRRLGWGLDSRILHFRLHGSELALQCALIAAVCFILIALALFARQWDLLLPGSGLDPYHSRPFCPALGSAVPGSGLHLSRSR